MWGVYLDVPSYRKALSVIFLRNLELCSVTFACALAVASTGCSNDDDVPLPTPIPVRDASVASDASRPSDAVDAGAPSDATAQPDAPSATGTVVVRILAMNDFHGNIQPPTGSNANVLTRGDDPIATGIGVASGDAGLLNIPAGGAAYVAAHLARLRAEVPANILVHAGDLTGATPLESAAFHDEPPILVFNALGLSYNAVGNHEFDHGTTELNRYQNGGCFPGDSCGDGGTFPGASFKYLAANVVLQSGGTLFPAYDIKEVGGEKIAFIGMTLKDTPSIVSAANVAGIDFRDEVATVNALVPEIRAKGAASIVVLIHQGGFPVFTTTYDGCNLAATDGGVDDPIVQIADALDPAVDAIVSGHTHRAYSCTIHGKAVTSAASYGRVVTALDLTIDRTTHRVVSTVAKNVPVTRNVTKDPAIDTLVQGYVAQSAARAGRVVGHIEADLLVQPTATGESNFGDFIADAMLASTASPTKGAAVIAFMNSGGIRADIRVAPLGTEAAGAVTFGKVFASQPFGNILTTVTLTGAQIKDALEQQFTGRVASPKILQPSAGLTYTYDLTAADGARVVAGSLQLNGVPLSPTASYRVTISDFVLGGGDGYLALKLGTNKLVGTSDLDALESYFASFGSASATVATPNAGRIHATP